MNSKELTRTVTNNGNKEPSLLEVDNTEFLRNRELLLLGDIDKIHALLRGMYGGASVIIRRRNDVPSEDDPIIVTLHQAFTLSEYTELMRIYPTVRITVGI